MEKHFIKKFDNFTNVNENNNTETILSSDDILKLKHNLEEYTVKNLMDVYTKVYVGKPFESITLNNKKIDISEYRSTDNNGTTSDDGIIINIDGEFKYFISVFGFDGYNINENRSLLTCWGHEVIYNIWLDNGEINEHEVD